MLTRMSFHSATISTIFKHYNSLLMLKNSPFNVVITNKIPTFIGFMMLVRRLGHSKEKWIFLHLSIIRNVANTKMFTKVIRGLPALEVLNFQSSSFLKALKYTESRNYLRILPGIKFGAGIRA